MRVKVLSEMVSEPLSLTEAKAWLRVKDFTEDDTLIAALVKSTRKHLEGYTGLSFGTRTLEVIMKIDEIAELPYSPVQSVTSVYKLVDNEWELVDTADWWLIGDDLKVLTHDTFKVTYQAGYTQLPDDLLTDMKVLVAWQYKNRGIMFEADKNGVSVMSYPHNILLNSWLYRKVVI